LDKEAGSNRVGIAEASYTNGLYDLWRSLRAANPDTVIDNCASGGRRLDYNSMALSVPLWISDCFMGECGGHLLAFGCAQICTR
jgi:alpha-galactosidase